MQQVEFISKFLFYIYELIIKNEFFLFNKKREKDIPECPLDRNLLDSNKKLFNDLAIDREILDLSVECKNENCFWTNKLSYHQVTISALFHLTCIFIIKISYNKGT